MSSNSNFRQLLALCDSMKAEKITTRREGYLGLISKLSEAKTRKALIADDDDVTKEKVVRIYNMVIMSAVVASEKNFIKPNKKSLKMDDMGFLPKLFQLADVDTLSPAYSAASYMAVNAPTLKDFALGKCLFYFTRALGQALVKRPPVRCRLSNNNTLRVKKIITKLLSNSIP